MEAEAKEQSKKVVIAATRSKSLLEKITRLNLEILLSTAAPSELIEG